MNTSHSSVNNVDRTPRSLSTRTVAKLLSVTMSISTAIAGCADDQGVVGPSLVSADMDSNNGSVSMPTDSTSTVDAAGDITTATDSEIAPTVAEIAGDADISTADIDSTVKETSSTMGDVTSAADTTVDTTTDTTVAVGPDSTIDTSVVETIATATDTSSNAAEVSTSTIDASSDTIPSSPKQICEKKKAEIIAALKPGAPECSETIPGVGTKAGKLVCDGTNLKPNCEID